MNSNEIKILAIESSCDETAAAVVVNGRDVRSNVISSQIALHTLYGGVVPEIASRKHIEKINQVIGQALSDAGMTLDDMVRSVSPTARGLLEHCLSEWRRQKPQLCQKAATGGCASYRGAHQRQLHREQRSGAAFSMPVVSGGHTHLVKVLDYGKYEILGKTRDDAAGEAFLTKWRVPLDSAIRWTEDWKKWRMEEIRCGRVPARQNRGRPV